VVLPIPPGMPGMFGPGPSEGQSEEPFQIPPDLSEPPLPGPTEKPKKKRKKPDPQWILSQATQTVTFWRLRDERMDEDQDLYEMAEPAIGPGEIVIKNTPFAIVEKIADILGSEIPVIEVPVYNERGRHQAQKVENYCRYLLEYWSEQHENSLNNPLLSDIARFFALRGWVAARIEYDPDASGPEEPPVRVTLYDPRQVYPSPGRGEIRFVIHQYYQTVSQTLDEWPEAKELLEGKQPTDLVKVTAYYDDTWHALFVEDQIIRKPTEHGYGFVPWVIRWARGAPYKATERDLSEWVRWVGVSAFEGIKPAYRKLNKLLSQLMTQVANATNPPMLYYYDPSNPEGPSPLSLEPGTTNYLIFDRERVDRLDLSPNLGQVAPLVQEFKEEIEIGGLPRVLWGIGDLSGFAMAMQSGAARQALYSIVRAMERTLEALFRYALILIRDLHDEPVGYFVRDPFTGTWVAGEALVPEEIGLVVPRVRVRYRDIAPRDRLAMGQLAIALTREKLISLETARDQYLGLENPQAENEKVLAEHIFLDEDVMRKALVPAALMQSDPRLWQLYLWAKEQEDLSRRQREAERQAPPQPPVNLRVPPPSPMSGIPNFAPSEMPPAMQATINPIDLFIQQSAGSSAGGMGLTGEPGMPGPGSIPSGPPLPEVPM
jgi:hypothetical protein